MGCRGLSGSILSDLLFAEVVDMIETMLDILQSILAHGAMYSFCLAISILDPLHIPKVELAGIPRMD
jgi:hypothetical protein